MPTTAVGSGSSPARPGVLARLVGVIFSPRETFEHIAADPKWLGALAVILVLMGAVSFAFMSTETGREAVLAKQMDGMEAFGMEITPEVEAQLERGLERSKYFSVFNGLFWAVVLVVVAAVMFGVFSAMGGTASFKQVFAVTVYSSVITAVQQLFSTPIAYARGSLDSSTNLAVLLPMLDDTSFLARLLGAIDLFWIWWIVVLAIGLAVLYRRRTQPILTTFLGVYAVVAIAIAAFMASRNG
jgi:hypothetical protein